MKVAHFLAVLFGFATVCLSQQSEISLVTPSGDPFSLARLAEGRWALAFVVVPNCPACEEVMGWFNRAAEAFPEIRFVLVFPETSPAAESFSSERVNFLVDEGGMFGYLLGVRRAPTVVIFVEGIAVEKVEWPFNEGFLLRKLAESLLIAFPNPKELLGAPAPDFSAPSLDGEKLAFSDLPRPILVAFLALGCAPCWEALPVLVGLSQEVPVVLIAIVGQSGLSEEDHKRLYEFLKQAREKGGVAFVLLDPLADGFPVSTGYKVRRSPTFIFVDKKGVVEGIWEGEESLDRLSEEICLKLVGGE